MTTENTQAFECPYCHTLNENYSLWKGIYYIECEDCDHTFYGKIIEKPVFVSEKERK